MTATLEHKGHIITLNEDRFDFIATGPHYPGGSRRFDSVRDAKQEIDERIAAEAKQGKTKIAIHAIDEAGEPVTVKGIHAATGELLAGKEGGDVYPASPWIAELLKYAQALRAQLGTIDKQTRNYRIRSKRCWGRVHADIYNDMIAALEKEFAEKAAKAEQNAPMKVSAA